jgi:hypothetical protein
MNDRIKLEHGDYGLRAVIAGPWSTDMVEFLLEKRIDELELNDGKGWRGDDLSFLATFPHLRSFKILDFNIGSVEPVHFLHELRSLDIVTYCKTALRFSAFPRLESCALEWRENATSLFDCLTLTKLFVNRYDSSNTTSFGRLANLESLAILNAPTEDLRGLSGLTKLRFLRLANLKRLKSLAGIETLTRVEELEIHTCRHVHSINEIGCLRRLRKLFLNNDGDIESIRPLAGLDELEWILFYESTNILDGDLAPLLKQKKLSRVAFQNRRHYSHRREQFGAVNRG